MSSPTSVDFLPRRLESIGISPPKKRTKTANLPQRAGPKQPPSLFLHNLQPELMGKILALLAPDIDNPDHEDCGLVNLSRVSKVCRSMALGGNGWKAICVARWTDKVGFEDRLAEAEKEAAEEADTDETILGSYWYRKFGIEERNASRNRITRSELNDNMFSIRLWFFPKSYPPSFKREKGVAPSGLLGGSETFRFVKEADARRRIMDYLREKDDVPPIEGPNEHVILSNASTNRGWARSNPKVILIRTDRTTRDTPEWIAESAGHAAINEAADRHAVEFAKAHVAQMESRQVVANFANELTVEKQFIFQLYREATDVIVEIPDQSIETNQALRKRLIYHMSNRQTTMRKSVETIATYTSGHYKAANLPNLRAVHEKGVSKAEENEDGCLLVGARNSYASLSHKDAKYDLHVVSAALKNGGQPEAGTIISGGGIPDDIQLPPGIDHPMFLSSLGKLHAAHGCQNKNCIECPQFVPRHINTHLHEWCRRHPSIPCRCKDITGFPCKEKKNVSNKSFLRSLRDCLVMCKEIREIAQQMDGSE